VGEYPPTAYLVEALAQRRRAGEPWEQAWPAVVERLPPRQRELLTTETFVTALREASERPTAPPRHAFMLGDLLDDARRPSVLR